MLPFSYNPRWANWNILSLILVIWDNQENANCMRTHSTQLSWTCWQSTVTQRELSMHFSWTGSWNYIVCSFSVESWNNTLIPSFQMISHTPLPTLMVPKWSLLICQNFSLPWDNLYCATIYINTNLSHQKWESEDSVKSTLFTIQVSDRGHIITTSVNFRLHENSCWLYQDTLQQNTKSVPTPPNFVSTILPHSSNLSCTNHRRLHMLTVS